MLHETPILQPYTTFTWRRHKEELYEFANTKASKLDIDKSSRVNTSNPLITHMSSKALLERE